MWRQVAVLLALAQCGCSGMFMWPEKTLVRDPSAAMLAFEDVTFASADGTRLHGWHLRAAAQPVRGTILFLHGNAENISTHLGFVHWLPPKGWNVFIWDYRGYGRSNGEAALGPLHQDAQAALAYVVGRGGPGAQALVVYGQSLGGSIALQTVANSPLRNHVRAVVSESAFSSYRSIAREKLSSLWLTWPLQWPLSFLFSNGWSADQVVDRIAPIPLLLVHGSADDVVPAHHALRLYAKAREPRELWVIEGANHQSSFAHPAQRARLLAWLDAHVAPVSAPVERTPE